MLNKTIIITLLISVSVISLIIYFVFDDTVFSLLLVLSMLLVSIYSFITIKIRKLPKKRAAMIFFFTGIIAQGLTILVLYLFLWDSEFRIVVILYALLASGVFFLINILHFSIVQDDPDKLTLYE